MIKRHRYYFVSAAVFIGLCLSLAMMMPKPTKEVPLLKDVNAIKSDRIPTAPRGFPTNDTLESKPIRVIPISTEAGLNQPTTPAVLTRIATAMPITPAREERSHTVSTPKTAVADPTPAEAVGAPHVGRHYSDVCAANDRRKVETNHGRSWRCAGQTRR